VRVGNPNRPHLVRIERRAAPGAMLRERLISEAFELLLGSGERLVPAPLGSQLGEEPRGHGILLIGRQVRKFRQRSLEELRHLFTKPL
jgi:hypothetical protein